MTLIPKAITLVEFIKWVMNYNACFLSFLLVFKLTDFTMMSLHLAHVGSSWGVLVPLPSFSWSPSFPSLHLSISALMYKLKWNCKLQYTFLCIIWLSDCPLSHWTSDVVISNLIYYWWPLNIKDCENVCNINHSRVNIYLQHVLKRGRDS